LVQFFRWGRRRKIFIEVVSRDELRLCSGRHCWCVAEHGLYLW
jgi:hypothetical protein